jgi:hypothetical protein
MRVAPADRDPAALFERLRLAIFFLAAPGIEDLKTRLA